jgi:hypothetical protein
MSMMNFKEEMRKIFTTGPFDAGHRRCAKVDARKHSNSNFTTWEDQHVELVHARIEAN